MKFSEKEIEAHLKWEREFINRIGQILSDKWSEEVEVESYSFPNKTEICICGTRKSDCLWAGFKLVLPWKEFEEEISNGIS